MEEHFPDSISIFGRDNLMKQFGPGTTPGKTGLLIELRTRYRITNDLREIGAALC